MWWRGGLTLHSNVLSSPPMLIPCDPARTPHTPHATASRQPPHTREQSDRDRHIPHTANPHSQPPQLSMCTACSMAWCGVPRARAPSRARVFVRARAWCAPQWRGGVLQPCGAVPLGPPLSLSLWVSPLCKPLCTRPPPAPGAALSLPCVFWVCRHCACAFAPYWRLMGATPCPRSTLAPPVSPGTAHAAGCTQSPQSEVTQSTCQIVRE